MDKIKNSKDIWATVTELKTRDVFCDTEYLGKKDLEKMIKFIILLINPEYELSKERVWEEKVSKIITFLGFSKKDKFFKEINDKTVYFTGMVTVYFKLIAIHHYERWYSAKEAFHNVNRMLRNPKTDPLDIVRLQKIADGQYKQLIKYEEVLFEDEGTRDIIAMASSRDVMTGYAEKYARNFNV